MTVPRREIIKGDKVGYYHCISRCVRRAFLCGFDKYIGKSYEHRKDWVRGRLSFLIEVFAIELVSYAVMSNHLHSLIRIRPDVSNKWTDREVATRWRMLFPLRWERGKPAKPNDVEIEAITSHKELVLEYRERLCSISWFNRCLNEHIAKRANGEDKCKGRFWEGRFRCQRVEDLSAILTCSTYIDLNPIRAGVSKTPEKSNYTSIQDRVRAAGGEVLRNYPYYPKLLSIEEVSNGTFSAKDYFALVDETGRLVIEGKGSIPKQLEPLLLRLKINPDKWVKTTKSYGTLFRRIVAPVENIRRAAEEIGKMWLHGITAAQRVFD